MLLETLKFARKNEGLSVDTAEEYTLQRARAQLDRAARLHHQQRFRTVITEEILSALHADAVGRELEGILQALPPAIHLQADISTPGRITVTGRYDAIRAIHVFLQGTAFLHGGRVILPNITPVSS